MRDSQPAGVKTNDHFVRASYGEELRRQMQERNQRSRAERELEMREAIAHRDNVIFQSPFGRSGGGAPILDHRGKITTGRMRFREETQDHQTFPFSTPQPRYIPNYKNGQNMSPFVQASHQTLANFPRPEAKNYIRRPEEQTQMVRREQSGQQMRQINGNIVQENIGGGNMIENANGALPNHQGNQKISVSAQTNFESFVNNPNPNLFMPPPPSFVPILQVSGEHYNPQNQREYAKETSNNRSNRFENKPNVNANASLNMKQKEPASHSKTEEKSFEEYVHRSRYDLDYNTQGRRSSRSISKDKEKERNESIDRNVMELEEISRKKEEELAQYRELLRSMEAKKTKNPIQPPQTLPNPQPPSATPAAPNPPVVNETNKPPEQAESETNNPRNKAVTLKEIPIEVSRGIDNQIEKEVDKLRRELNLQNNNIHEAVLNLKTQAVAAYEEKTQVMREIDRVKEDLRHQGVLENIRQKELDLFLMRGYDQKKKTENLLPHTRIPEGRNEPFEFPQRPMPYYNIPKRLPEKVNEDFPSLEGHSEKLEVPFVNVEKDHFHFDKVNKRLFNGKVSDYENPKNKAIRLPETKLGEKNIIPFLPDDYENFQDLALPEIPQEEDFSKKALALSRKKLRALEGYDDLKNHNERLDYLLNRYGGIEEESENGSWRSSGGRKRVRGTNRYDQNENNEF